MVKIHSFYGQNICSVGVCKKRHVTKKEIFNKSPLEKSPIHHSVLKQVNETLIEEDEEGFVSRLRLLPSNKRRG